MANFNTSVLAYEVLPPELRRWGPGLATTIAVVIFILVTPVVIYNIRQMQAGGPMTGVITDAQIVDAESRRPQRSASRRRPGRPLQPDDLDRRLVIAVIWTIPHPSGCWSSFRCRRIVKTSGWWTIF